MILRASIQRLQLQTDEAEETCKAACHICHPLQRRISLASLCSVASSDSTLDVWRRGKVLKLKRSFLAQMDITLVISSWKFHNFLLFFRGFPEAEQWNSRQQMGQGLPWEQGEGFCRDWKCWCRNTLLGYLCCSKFSHAALNEHALHVQVIVKQRTKSPSSFQILLRCV